MATAELSMQLDEFCRSRKLPGAGAVIVQGASREVAVAGLRRKTASEKIEPSDRFHIASNTKAFTGLLLALAVEAGELSFETTLAEAFPAEAAQMHSELREVTLRELLTHRSGIPPYTAGAEFSKLPEFSGDTRSRRHQFALHLLHGKPQGKRGDYLYSNAGYALAAAVLEQKSGRSYEDLLQERVLSPLDIEALWGWPARGGVAAPWGHGPGLFGLKASDPDGDYHLEDYMNPAGGLSLSMKDYGAFLDLQLRALRNDDEGLPISAAAVRMTHEAVGDYALGWLERDYSGQPMSGHEGSLGTFHIIALVLPQSNLALALVANAGGDSASGAVQDYAIGAVEELCDAGR